jgi:hypothetical protein
LCCLNERGLWHLGSDHISRTQRAWRDSDSVCAFADAERHLGHLVKVDEWHAYDATHPNLASNGMNYLGRFSDLAAAKQAVESAVSRAGAPKAMRVSGK